jgi:adenosylcobinamide-GDP ribazoletransferase
MSEANPWRQRLAELKQAFGLLTRLPVHRLPTLPATAPGTNAWAYPLAGAAIGAIGGVSYAIAYWLACPPPLAALFALAATILATGALHEDGLADFADGLGGNTKEDRLAIMRDHRIGTYGVVALLLVLAMRATAIVLLAKPGLVLATLMAAGAASRASAVLLMTALPPARQDGLSVSVGRPSAAMTAATLGIAFVLGVVLLSFGAGFLVLASALTAAALVGRIAQVKLGGQTGDVLGAACALGESLALTAIAAAYA